jgi:hypothetical protein
LEYETHSDRNFFGAGDCGRELNPGAGAKCGHATTTAAEQWRTSSEPTEGGAVEMVSRKSDDQLQGW